MLTDFLGDVGNIPRVNPHTHKVNLVTQLTRYLNSSWHTDAKGVIGIHKKDTIFVGRSISLESLIVIAINLYQGMGMGPQDRNVKELPARTLLVPLAPPITAARVPQIAASIS